MYETWYQSDFISFEKTAIPRFQKRHENKSTVVVYMQRIVTDENLHQKEKLESS